MESKKCSPSVPQGWFVGRDMTDRDMLRPALSGGGMILVSLASALDIWRGEPGSGDQKRYLLFND